MCPWCTYISLLYKNIPVFGNIKNQLSLLEAGKLALNLAKQQGLSESDEQTTEETVLEADESQVRSLSIKSHTGAV